MNLPPSKTAKTNYILVATDDPSVCESLRHAGYSIVQAPDGQSALELCTQRPPALAILDLELPKITGIELAERFHHENSFPIILLSSTPDESIVQRVFDSGVMSYLIKPVDSARLIVKMELARRRFAEMATLRAETAKLTGTVKHAKVISMAVGILMERLHLPEKEAYERLRAFARSRSTKVSDVAEELLKRAGDLNLVVDKIESMGGKRRGEADSD